MENETNKVVREAMKMTAPYVRLPKCVRDGLVSKLNKNTMNEKSINILKEKVISSYKRKGENKALISKGRSWTGNELAKEIQDESEFGLNLLSNILELSIFFFTRDKIKLDDVGVIPDLESLKDPKMWKAGGVGGQDQYAGLPPAIRIIDHILKKLE